MPIANASLLDEGTAAAEAMAMAYGIVNKSSKNPAYKFFVSTRCFRQTIDVVLTRATPHNIEVVVGNPDTAEFDKSFFGALIQYPVKDGAVVDRRGFIKKVHDAGAVAIVATDLMALALLTPPGEFGADIVIGNTQRFGIPLVSAVRMQRSLQLKTNTFAVCRAALLVFRLMRKIILHTAWPFKLANSTFAERKRLQTYVQRGIISNNVRNVCGLSWS